jgi:hypothetical protein
MKTCSFSDDTLAGASQSTASNRVGNNPYLYGFPCMCNIEHL